MAEVGVEFRLLLPLTVLRACLRQICLETTDPAKLHDEIRSSAIIEDSFHMDLEIAEIAISCFTEIFIPF